MAESLFFTMKMLMLSSPWALFGSKIWIILAISSQEKLTENNRGCQSSNEGEKASLLLLFITKFCFAKNALKSSDCSSKSVTNLFSWNNGGIRRVFCLKIGLIETDMSEYVPIRISLDISQFARHSWVKILFWFIY